jgi:uncharacterized protein YcbX
MSHPDSVELSRIRIYPLKSFDGVEIDKATLTGLGGLVGDREFRLVDDRGGVINTKRKGDRTTTIRCHFEESGRVVSFGTDESDDHFRLPDDLIELAVQFTSRLGEQVRIERNQDTGFPDDEDASGPTIVSTATLREVASWFGWLEEEARRRFRANLEVGGVPAFWEDRLVGEKGELRVVRIGAAELEAINPCARCAVPSRDPYTGEITDPTFAKTFAERRKETLPRWARRSRFDHFYRLSVNTRIPPTSSGKTIAVGDRIELAQ